MAVAANVLICLLASAGCASAQFHLLGQGQYNKEEATTAAAAGDDGAGSDLVCPDGELVIGFSRDGPGVMKVICGAPIAPLMDSQCETRGVSLDCDLEEPDGCDGPHTYMKGLEVIRTGTGADIIFPICCTASNFELGYEGACERHFVNARLRPGEHIAADDYAVTKFTCHNVVQHRRAAGGKVILDQVFFTHDCPYTVEEVVLDYEGDGVEKKLFKKKQSFGRWVKRS